ncbi:hypothetical protein ACWF94_36940, partial [Streptomyces sp. NPDC055078]
MFGLTTQRRLRQSEQDLRDEIDAHHATIRQLREFEQQLIPAYAAVVRERSRHLREKWALQRRLTRALRGADRWRKQADQEHRTVVALGEQLLTATSGHNTAARAATNLPEAGPWERAVDGLNALVDAEIPFHVEPDGHISNSSGDEHIEWDRTANRWRLVHDDEELPAAPATAGAVIHADTPIA